MESQLDLSVVIITYNEEKHIQDCLASVSWASDVVVVDSGSTDNTRTLAKENNARVIEQPFLGFGKQKQFAIDQAKYDWVFLLDADERISPELAQSIRTLFATTKEKQRHHGYVVNRCSFHLGKWIHHGGWYPDKILRLVNRKYGGLTDVEIHEEIQVQGTSGFLKGHLLHYVFNDLTHNVNKNNLYSSIGAASLYKAGKKPSLLKMLLKPLSKFIECYVYKLGFLDGLAGFIIAIGAAYSMFLKQSKLWEIYQQQKTNTKT